jgi:hypothetical protein
VNCNTFLKFLSKASIFSKVESLVSPQQSRYCFRPSPHPNSVDLFNTFPDVLLMDSMYKTNRYNMPLFEMVGVTSTDKTFNVALISNEKEDNYTWALQECQKLSISKKVGPKVVVNDRDPALMRLR